MLKIHKLSFLLRKKCAPLTQIGSLTLICREQTLFSILILLQKTQIFGLTVFLLTHVTEHGCLTWDCKLLEVQRNHKLCTLLLFTFKNSSSEYSLRQYRERSAEQTYFFVCVRKEKWAAKYLLKGVHLSGKCQTQCLAPSQFQ